MCSHNKVSNLILTSIIISLGPLIMWKLLIHRVKNFLRLFVKTFWHSISGTQRDPEEPMSPAYWILFSQMKIVLVILIIWVPLVKVIIRFWNSAAIFRLQKKCLGEQLNYAKGDYVGLCKNMDIDWELCLAQHNNIEDMWTAFKGHLLEGIEQHISKISKFYDWRKPSWKCPLPKNVR